MGSTSYARKRKFAVIENVKAFIDRYGVENCGFFTVTFALEGDEPLSVEECNSRLNSYHTNVLRGLFSEYVRVLEFQRNGMPHFHYLVLCSGDIREGFNWSHYEAVRDWNRARRAGSKPKGDLGRNNLLRGLHRRLNDSGAGYGIGRMELVPIRSCGEAVGVYVGGYLSKSGATGHAKGSRAVTYSRGFQRAVKGSFAFHVTADASGWLFREKVRCLAFRHKLYVAGDWERLVKLTGAAGPHKLPELCRGERLEYWPTADAFCFDSTAPRWAGDIQGDDIRHVTAVDSLQEISRICMADPVEAERVFGGWAFWSGKSVEEAESYRERVTGGRRKGAKVWG